MNNSSGPLGRIISAFLCGLWPHNNIKRPSRPPKQRCSPKGRTKVMLGGPKGRTSLNSQISSVETLDYRGRQSLCVQRITRESGAVTKLIPFVKL